jgi:hypothetical protein
MQTPRDTAKLLLALADGDVSVTPDLREPGGGSSGLPDSGPPTLGRISSVSHPSSAVAGHTSLKPIIFLTRPRELVRTASMGSRSARRKWTGRGTAPSFSLNAASGEAGRVMPIS